MPLLRSFGLISRDRFLCCRLLALGLLALVAAGAAENAAILAVDVPRFTHPGAGQIFYFVLTDRFANGTNANDTGGISGGGTLFKFTP